MNKTHTEATAKQKLCHQMMMQGRCCGNLCMAWQWAGSARLSCSTALLPRYAESAFDGYQANGEYEMPDLEAVHFNQPIGDG